ncbi:MAG: hypothetical protein AAFR47_20575 [Pseudomonadota bacterium]
MIPSLFSGSVCRHPSIDRARAEGRPEPEPVPHPDHIHIDMNTGSVRIRGPFTKEEKRALDDLRDKKAGIKADTADLEPTAAVGPCKPIRRLYPTFDATTVFWAKAGSPAVSILACLCSFDASTSQLSEPQLPARNR